MGGKNSDDNIVALTAREHLIAHKLLVKIFNQTPFRKMCLAGLWAMATLRKDGKRVKITSREFDRLRTEYFNSRKGIAVPQHTRNKIAETLKGRKITPETIEKRNKTKAKNILNGTTKIVRKKLSEEEKLLRKERMKKLSADEKKAAAEKSRKTKEGWSKETREIYSKKLSESNCGKKRSKSQRARMSQAQLGHEVAASTREKISKAQIGKKRGRLKPFKMLSPSGEIITWTQSIHDFSRLYNVPLKYLYLSKKKINAQ
jgi:hypothetical protein